MEASVEKVLVAERRPRRTGPLISFSGPEGSGKSILAVEAARLLKSRGWRVSVLHSYPLSLYTGGLFGRLHKDDPSDHGGFTDILLSMLGRWVFRTNLFFLWLAIRALRANGVAVVCDRYPYDALVQIRHVGGCSAGFLRRWARWAPKPDLAFLLKIEPKKAVKKAKYISSRDCAEKIELYDDLAQLVEFWVIDAASEKRCTEEMRGILAYAMRYR